MTRRLDDDSRNVLVALCILAKHLQHASNPFIIQEEKRSQLYTVNALGIVIIFLYNNASSMPRLHATQKMVIIITIATLSSILIAVPALVHCRLRLRLHDCPDHVWDHPVHGRHHGL